MNCSWIPYLYQCGRDWKSYINWWLISIELYLYVEIPCILCRPVLNSMKWKIHSKIRLRKGKWVLLGIFPAPKWLIKFYCYCLFIQTCHNWLIQSVTPSIVPFKIRPQSWIQRNNCPNFHLHCVMQSLKQQVFKTIVPSRKFESDCPTFGWQVCIDFRCFRSGYM